MGVKAQKQPFFPSLNICQENALTEWSKSIRHNKRSLTSERGPDLGMETKGDNPSLSLLNQLPGLLKAFQPLQSPRQSITSSQLFA